MMKKEILIVLMIISIFLVSACDVYDALYVKEPEEEEVLEVPEEAITIEIEEDMEEELEEVAEEVIEEIDIEDIFWEETPEVTSNEIRSVGAAGFDPDELTIGAGSTVTWINDDEKAVYIIIFKDGKSYLNIPRINSGQQIEHEFTEPGEYECWQNIAFTGNSGKIIVEDLGELEESMEEVTGEVVEEVDIEDLLEEEAAEEEEEGIEEIVIDIEDIFEEEVEVVEVPEEVIVIEIEEEEEEVEIEDIFEEEKEIPEDAIVIIVDETELVSLVPRAEDPDADVLTFAFTSPLDENGEWQTTYGDAGEYTVTVTASDGLLTSSKEVLVIVNRKEEAPILDSFKPEEIVIEICEIDTLAFDIVASDLNNDELTYAWKLDGVSIGNENSIVYQTTYEDAGSHTVKVSISDGMFETEKIWSVTVNNVNRKPVLSKVYDIEARETDTVVVQLEATDDDGDALSFGIDDVRFVQDGNVFTWETTYDDAGEHVVTATVSDGVDEASEKFTVTIKNVNRAPIILDIVQKQ